MATTDERRKLSRLTVGRSLIELEQTAIIELYELYFDVNQDPFRFHSGTNNLLKNIVWNGNSYHASAIEVEGFETNIMGRLPRPKVTVSNKDYIISNILRDYSDFRDGKFVRVKVFLKHLDDINFDDEVNPFGKADPFMYISKEKYIVSQKIIENKELIQFELITPFDLQSLEVATRAIYGRYCYWQYRGSGCGYQGDLICLENDQDFFVKPNVANGQTIRNAGGFFVNGTYLDTIKKFLWQENKFYRQGDIVYVENIDFSGLKDPPHTFFVCQVEHTSDKTKIPTKFPQYWLRDGCGKNIESCKKRFFSENKTFTFQSKDGIYTARNDSDVTNGVLPFGGFPGTDRFNYE